METDRGIDKLRRELLTRLMTSNCEPNPGLENEPPLNTKDVAMLFRMSERAIRLSVAKGQLPHTRTLGGGRLLYPADQIAELYARYQSKCSPVRGRRQEP